MKIFQKYTYVISTIFDFHTAKLTEYLRCIICFTYYDKKYYSAKFFNLEWYFNKQLLVVQNSDGLPYNHEERVQHATFPHKALISELQRINKLYDPSYKNNN